MFRGKLLVNLAKNNLLSFDYGNSKNDVRALDAMQKETTSEKVYRYLENVPLPCNQEKAEDLSHSEFIAGKTDDVETTSEKVYRYLENVPLPCNQEKPEDLSHSEFIAGKTDDVVCNATSCETVLKENFYDYSTVTCNSVEKLPCTTNAEPDLIYEFSLENERSFGNTVSHTTVLNTHPYEEIDDLKVIDILKNSTSNNTTKDLHKITVLQDVLLNNLNNQENVAQNHLCNTKNVLEKNRSEFSNINKHNCEFSDWSEYSDSDSQYEPSTYSSSSVSEKTEISKFSSSNDKYEENVVMTNRPETYFAQNTDNDKVSVINSALLPTSSQNLIQTKENVNCLCPICFEQVGHFSRHLLTKHSDEETVKPILKFPLKSKERRMAIVVLRKKGNFLLNQQKIETIGIKVVRKPNKKGSKRKIDNGEYFPCVNCLGYFRKSYLWRHRKTCGSTNIGKEGGTKIQHLGAAHTLLVSTGLLGNFLEKSRLKTEVLDIMRADQISLAAKSDALICLYGESYLSKHKRKQMNVVVSNKMRELGRLKIALEKSTSITNLIDILKPEMYNHIVTATKIIAGFDVETKSYKASSLALHLGTNLKFLCDVAKKAIITQDPLFIVHDSDERKRKQKDISQLRQIITSHWCNDVASLANKVLNQAKWVKPKLLPVTEDIIAFKSYISKVADSAYEKLMNNIDMKLNYKLLSEATLCIVLVFNRKRIGEVQFLEIENYQRHLSTVTQQESMQALSELEKTMCMTFKRVVVFGKGSKLVSILLTKQMQKYIDILIKIRKSSDIVPGTNKYLFANPGSIDRWMSGTTVLRKYAQKCGAKNPELLTSTKFRKQIATILQLTSFDKNEMEQMARFMGHTEKTHMEFYRLTEDVYQTAKVAKVLLLLNEGKGIELKGKNLEEIDISDDVLEIEENEQIKKRKTDNPTESEKETSDCSNEEESQENDAPLKKKQNRATWHPDEKKLVLDFFKSNIRRKAAPKKEECFNFIKQNSNLFIESDWVRIKTLVYNTYRLK